MPLNNQQHAYPYAQASFKYYHVQPILFQQNVKNIINPPHNYSRTHRNFQGYHQTPYTKQPESQNLRPEDQINLDVDTFQSTYTKVFGDESGKSMLGKRSHFQSDFNIQSVDNRIKKKEKPKFEGEDDKNKSFLKELKSRKEASDELLRIEKESKIKREAEEKALKEAEERKKKLKSAESKPKNQPKESKKSPTKNDSSSSQDSKKKSTKKRKSSKKKRKNTRKSSENSAKSNDSKPKSDEKNKVESKDKEEEKPNHIVDYNNIKPGTEKFKKMSQNFPIPLNEVLQFEEGIGFEIGTFPDPKNYADLTKLSQNVNFTSYLSDSFTKTDFSKR